MLYKDGVKSSFLTALRCTVAINSGTLSQPCVMQPAEGNHLGPVYMEVGDPR